MFGAANQWDKENKVPVILLITAYAFARATPRKKWPPFGAAEAIFERRSRLFET